MQQDWKGLAGPGTVGLEVALSVAVGLFGGAWLDEKFATKPWLTVIGLGYGLAAAGRAIYRALKKANREVEQLDQREHEARKKFDDGKRTP